MEGWLCLKHKGCGDMARVFWLTSEGHFCVKGRWELGQWLVEGGYREEMVSFSAFTGSDL